MNRMTLFARSSYKHRIEEQLVRCRQVASSKGLPLEGAQILMDTGPRAAAPVARRPAYGKLVESIRKGRCDLVVVDEVIVLTSDIEELAHLWTYVRAGALRLVTADGVDTGWLCARQRAR
ncbi:recombinase family protein [Ramlibacter sp. MMS24-I3-19]|uniref:recombinase family protein n=1 Tax=Ramlibacter sp. MMS24-I3-19 TaxID=3416606 RepID=UPI003D04F5A8